MAAASHRTATVLSEITKHPVDVAVPSVSLARDGVQEEFRRRFSGGATRIRVPFSGEFSGTGILLLDPKSAQKLARRFQDVAELSRLPQDEILLEVGSILLNACIGTFGNMIPAQIIFGVPEIQTCDRPSETLLDVVTPNEVVWAETNLTVHAATISGVVVLCAPVATAVALLDGKPERPGR